MGEPELQRCDQFGIAKLRRVSGGLKARKDGG